MTKRRIIFFAIFVVYELIMVFVTVHVNAQINAENYKFLMSIASNFHIYRYGVFLGLILLLIDIIWSWRSSSIEKKKYDALLHENNSLKAKVYDLQESSKESGPATIK